MSTKILHILCEGQTEDAFVHGVLKPYLLNNGYYGGVKTVLVTTNRKLELSGGMTSYQRVKEDLHNMLSSFRDGDYEKHIFTTMFDFYALPTDFPAYSTAHTFNDKYKQVECLEEGIKYQIVDARFIPYIQLHEFEALVFCGLDFLYDLYPKSDKCIKLLKNELEQAGGLPEMVNNSPQTAPSKRLINAFEEMYNYDKVQSGKYITNRVGIEKLCSMCPHFKTWIDALINC